MFLETMSPETIIKEVRRDITAIENRRDIFIKAHRRDILFAKKFPVSFRFEWKSPLTYNKWHITIVCENKKERENPTTYHYATYETRRGMGIIFPGYSMHSKELVFNKFTSHFFSRYRTRHLIPKGIYTPGMDVIRHFVDHNISFFFPPINTDNNFTCCFTDGIALGDYDKTISIFRTFLSRDMLFQIQERVLHSSIEYQHLIEDFINNKLSDAYKEFCILGRIGKLAGPDPAPKLSLDDVKDLLKDKPKIPLFSPLTGKIELED